MAKRTPLSQRVAREKFLEAYRRVGTVGGAAREIGVDRSTVYYWGREDKDFCAAVLAVRQDLADEILQELRRRAIEGVEETRTDGGKVIKFHRYPDRMIELIARATVPELATLNEQRLTIASAVDPFAQAALDDGRPRYIIAAPEDDHERELLAARMDEVAVIEGYDGGVPLSIAGPVDVEVTVDPPDAPERPVDPLPADPEPMTVEKPQQKAASMPWRRQ